MLSQGGLDKAESESIFFFHFVDDGLARATEDAEPLAQLAYRADADTRNFGDDRIGQMTQERLDATTSINQFVEHIGYSDLTKRPFQRAVMSDGAVVNRRMNPAKLFRIDSFQTVHFRFGLDAAIEWKLRVTGQASVNENRLETETAPRARGVEIVRILSETLYDLKRRQLAFALRTFSLRCVLDVPAVQSRDERKAQVHRTRLDDLNSLSDRQFLTDFLPLT